MATIYKVDCPTRKPIFIGVQEENESNFIQFDITPWVEKHGAGAATANAKTPNSTEPYPVIVQQDGNIVTWRPKTADVAIEGTGAFQLIYTVGEVVARTQIWATNIGPSLIGSGDPPDPIPDYIDEMREIAADAIQAARDADESADDAQAEVVNAQNEVKNAEAWAVGQRGGVDVPSTDPAYENNAKYWAEQSLANQYGAFIVKSASGDIASFSDGADDVPMKSLNVTITPKQSGSGDPSPSNVRPITGYSTVNVYRGGHNYAEDLEIGAINTDGSDNADSNSKRTPYIPVTEGEKVVCDWKNGGAGYRYSRIVLYDASKTFVSLAYNAVVGAGQSHTEVVTIPSGVAYLRFCSFNCPPQIIYKVIDNVDVTTVTLGSTVYGGEVDVTEGILADTKVALTGSDIVVTAVGTNASGHKWADITATGLVSGGAVMCDKYKQVYGSSTEANVLVAYTNAITVVDDRFTSTSVAQNLLRTENTMFVYNRQTPQTVQLTPAQVASLLGENNVWADCGAVEVEYRADPTLAYAEISPSVANVIAPVEETNIATRNYTTGSLLIMNNMLYKVTANIANGGAITPNTNVTATTLAEVISAL